MDRDILELYNFYRLQNIFVIFLILINYDNDINSVSQITPYFKGSVIT
jgi:hypothetical protein